MNTKQKPFGYGYMGGGGRIVDAQKTLISRTAARIRSIMGKLNPDTLGF